MKDKLIEIYVDGSSLPSPGAMGCGIVMIYGEYKKELSRYIGQGTNNIAELMAVQVGLEQVKDRSIPILIYSDSLYVVNTLSEQWNAKLNIGLIIKIKKIIAGFSAVSFEWIKGHSGNVFNERACDLAYKAALKLTISEGV